MHREPRTRHHEVNDEWAYLSNLLEYSDDCSMITIHKILVLLTIYQSSLKFSDTNGARTISIDSAEGLPEVRIGTSWRALLMAVHPGSRS